MNLQLLLVILGVMLGDDIGYFRDWFEGVGS